MRAMKSRLTKGYQTACLLLALLFVSVAALAKERVQRRFDQSNGLAASSVYSLCQDEAGFIWIGAVGGLVRYDGLEMRQWAKDLTRPISFILSGPAGELLAGEDWGEYHRLYRITPDGASPVAGPDGKPLNQVVHATFDGEGRLWILNAGSLLYRLPSGGWTSVSDNAFAGERAWRLRPVPEGGVLLITDKAVWQSNAGGSVRKILDISRAADVLFHPDGTIYALTSPRPARGELFELRGGRLSLRLALQARPIHLALRGQTVWASFDRFLAALRPDQPPEVLGSQDGVPSGGSWLLDREGSLWLGTFLGLIQFPEPETVLFNDKDGLPSAHTRFLRSTQEGVWVSTWQGLGRIEKAQGAWKARSEKSPHFGAICPDGDGALWLRSPQPDEVWKRHKGRLVKYKVAGFGRLGMCAPAADGTIWLGTSTGLFRSSLTGGAPRRVYSPLEGEEIAPLCEDSHGRIWISTGGELVCHAPTESGDAGGQSNWSCETLDAVCAVTSIAQVSAGSLWMSTECAGVWRLTASAGWTPVPASQSLPSRNILRLVPSLSGGVWVLGHGTSIRVIERPDLAEGWEVVERLSFWQGLPEGEAGDILEQPDGALWITTTAGVVHIPPAARRAIPQPPRVELIGLLVNGQRVAFDQTPQLPYGANQLELRFAALSYRDRSRLRYQHRLRADAPWTDSADSLPHFRFINLGSGRYVAEVRASLDGVNWSAVPARFAFEVLTPWYFWWWVIALFALALSGAIYAAHRVRVAFLLRLERQRTRIAMDLHDEIGSGLGSIGILSHVLADESLRESKRQELAREIASTSGELGAALTGIVWALSSGSTTLEQLAYHLTEHAGRLFPANQTIFSTEFPARWPVVNLSLAVRRNLQLIALEALHNAARHAQAGNVTLGVRPLGRQWQLWISDDGVGLCGDNKNRNGLGLRSMKQRAAEIDADISWVTAHGKGTTVTITFDPQASDRRLK
ncbi:MAG TPA: two-component regulator propeller domain-containing protein [Blastocatellia bacterium]|nr:two-component regulator propeller domain-containing protein [Blastocatellia bacterium]